MQLSCLVLFKCSDIQVLVSRMPEEKLWMRFIS